MSGICVAKPNRTSEFTSISEKPPFFSDFPLLAGPCWAKAMLHAYVNTAPVLALLISGELLSRKFVSRLLWIKA
jgi:hypothetical protein